MKDKKNQTMQFLFADRELIITMADLLAAPVDVIVNPANAGLSHGGGVAAQIVQQGGETIQLESDLFIKEHGMLESGMVAPTTAGHLPYDAIIHAVGPKMGEGDELRKIQQAVARSLQLCDMHDWKSIAFPAISTGIFGVAIEIAAQAFYRAITSYWDARIDSAPEKIIVCLTEKNFHYFITSIREISLHEKNIGNAEDEIMDEVINSNNVDAEPEAGIVNFSEEDLSSLDGDESDNWFN